MLQIKDKFKFMLALFISLVIVGVPCLHAWQINGAGGTCTVSFSCGYSCGQGEAPSVEIPLLESPCCCNVSTPTKETEYPLEAQLRPTSNPELFNTVKLVAPRISVVEIESSHIVKINQHSVHGPPLYALKASYLI